MKLQLNDRYLNVLESLGDSKIILPANLVTYKGWTDNLSLDEIVKT